MGGSSKIASRCGLSISGGGATNGGFSQGRGLEWGSSRELEVPNTRHMKKKIGNFETAARCAEGGVCNEATPSWGFQTHGI